MEVQKGQGKWGVFLAIVLLTIQLSFQLKLINVVFLVLILLMITVGFLPEKYRIFIWLMVSFSGGMFAFIYIDRLLLEFSFSIANLLIFNRILLLFPIILMLYVLFMFKEKMNGSMTLPEWNKTFIRLGEKKLTFKVLYTSVSIFLLAPLLLLILGSNGEHTNTLWKAITFALLNGLLVEVLWRGILLSRMKLLIGEKLAVLMTSISCSFAYYLFGYSFELCLSFFLIFVFFGLITVKVRTLFPVISWNVLLTMNLIYLNVIPLLA
jgi:uncharacterized protein